MVEKIPFPILNLEVAKLYEKEFVPSDLKGIDNHCQFIRDFINACGWDETDFIMKMMELDDHEFD